LILPGGVFARGSPQKQRHERRLGRGCFYFIGNNARTVEPFEKKGPCSQGVGFNGGKEVKLGSAKEKKPLERGKKEVLVPKKPRAQNEQTQNSEREGGTLKGTAFFPRKRKAVKSNLGKSDLPILFQKKNGRRFWREAAPSHSKSGKEKRGGGKKRSLSEWERSRALFPAKEGKRGS